MTDSTRDDRPTGEPASNRPLSVAEAITLGMILTAAQAGQRVARLTTDGDLLVGTARHIVADTDTAAFPHAGQDVRNCYLRVTPDSGIGEYFWPVLELIDEHQQATFVTGYQS